MITLNYLSHISYLHHVLKWLNIYICVDIYIYILSFWVYVSLFDEERKLSVFNIYIQICKVFGTGLYFIKW